MPITNISRDWGVSPSIVRITTTDNLATITTAGYLNTQVDEIESIQHGEFQWVPTDIVAIVFSGGQGQFAYDPINNTFVLDSGAIPPNSINTANIVNQAVTRTKIANAAVGFTQIDPSVGQFVPFIVNSNGVHSMFATPIAVASLSAPGIGQIVVIQKIVARNAYVGTQYSGGGNIGFQYGNAPNLAGPAATTTFSGVTLNGFTESFNFYFEGTVGTAPITQTVNQGIFLTNDTAPFADGVGQFLRFDIYFTTFTA